MNNNFSYSPQVSDSFEDCYQMNCATLPMTPGNSKIPKQDNNQLRDILMKYLVIDEDDSKFNFKEESQNSNNGDSQKSTFLSQYRKNINYTKSDDKGNHMEVEQDESKEGNKSKERGNFGKSISHLFKTQTKDKKIQQGFLTPSENGSAASQSSRSKIDSSFKLSKDSDYKPASRQNVWNTERGLDFESKKKGRMNFSSSNSSSANSSLSRDQKDKNMIAKRNVKRPLTSIVQENKHKKNNFAMNLTMDRENKQRKANKEFTPTKGKPLQGKSVFVDVYTNDRENISDSVSSILFKLGADVKKKFSKYVDLLIWKDGSEKHYENADNQKIPILSIHWLEKCQQENKFIEATQEYLVPKPHKMVSDLSSRVDKIYQKYEKNKEKEFKKKAKMECLPLPQKKREDSLDDEDIMSCWQRTAGYQILSQKQLKDEIRCQEELEQYYHDIIQECYLGKFTSKWNKRNLEEPILEKYQEHSLEIEGIFERRNTQQYSIHTSELPETSEEKTLYVGIDSMKKQQKTMQDFFGLKKVVSHQNNDTQSTDDKIHVQEKPQEDIQQIKPNISKNTEMEIEAGPTESSEHQSQASSLKQPQPQQQQQPQLQSNTKQNTMVFTAKKPISSATQQNSTSQKPSVFDMLSKKKVVSTNNSSSLISAKKVVYPNNSSIHNNNNLMRFGFSFKKVQKTDQMSQEDNEKPKLLKIGYINLSQNQIQVLQNCRDTYLQNYEICGEKDHFQEDVIILGNQNINSQHNPKGSVVKAPQTINQLRILSVIANNKDVVNFKWIEDSMFTKCEISKEEYREYNEDWNKNIFTGFDFSIYLDQAHRKNNEIMRQKSEIEKIIKYFGGRVLENSKNASYVIFFKEQSKTPSGYDDSNCVLDKWIYESILHKTILSKQAFNAIQ